MRTTPSKAYDLSLRQLYYQLVSRQPLSFTWSNTEQNYKRLGTIINDARNAGLIDWAHIKDRGRETVENSHWTTPGEILYSAARSFRIDTWIDQPNYVAVMVEKQALEGVLAPVCRDLDIAFTANKGYASGSLMYEFGSSRRRCSTTWDAPPPTLPPTGDAAILRGTEVPYGRQV